MKLVVAKAVVFALAALLGSAAAGSLITVSPREAHAGETVSVAGTGCAPDANVMISLDAAAAAEAKTNPQGAFRAPVTVPDGTKPGDHTITVTGFECGASATLTVLEGTAEDDNSSWRVLAAISIWLAGIVLAGVAVVAVLRWDTVRNRQVGDGS